MSRPYKGLILAAVSRRIKYLLPASRARLPVNGQITFYLILLCYIHIVIVNSLRSLLLAKAYETNPPAELVVISNQ